MVFFIPSPSVLCQSLSLSLSLSLLLSRSRSLSLSPSIFLSLPLFDSGYLAVRVRVCDCVFVGDQMSSGSLY